MANKYSKVNLQKKEGVQDKDNKGAKELNESEMTRYEEQRKRLDRGAKVMAIIVILAMLVSAFLSAGVFLFN